MMLLREGESGRLLATQFPQTLSGHNSVRVVPVGEVENPQPLISHEGTVRPGFTP